MKKLLILILLLLLPIQSPAFMFYGDHTPSGGAVTCNTRDNTPITSYEVNESTENLSDTNAIGMQFTVSSDANLYSIEVHLTTIGGAETLTARYGSGTDLTTFLDSTTTGIDGGDAGTWVELVFQDTDNTLNGVYYVGMLNSGAATVAWTRGFPAAAAGVAIDASSGWTMGSLNTSVSRLIKVYQCAD